MSVESLVAEIQRLRREDNEFVPPPASQAAVVELAQQFEEAFGIALPTAYQNVLRLSDGVMFDGLIMWPTHAYWLFRESLVDANRDLRETIEESFLYFGQRDDILFALNLKTGKYEAIDISGLTVWETFKDCHDMLAFMLRRVVDDDGTTA